MGPIPNHDGGARIDSVRLQRLAEDERLVGHASGEVRAVDPGEIPPELEVIGDALGKVSGLETDQVELAPRSMELCERRRNPGIEAILEDAYGLEACAIRRQRRVDLDRFLAAEQLTERLGQWRTDEPLELVGRGRGTPKTGQCMLDAPNDALARVGECPVEVDEDIAHQRLVGPQPLRSLGQEVPVTQELDYVPGDRVRLDDQGVGDRHGDEVRHASELGALDGNRTVAVSGDDEAGN